MVAKPTYHFFCQIGRSIAILFALEGADSTIGYLPSEQEDAENVKAYIAEKTKGARTLNLVALDLKTEANCKQIIDEHMKVFGRLDVLVPNAAQQLENHDITTLDSKQWEETFQLNIHHVRLPSKRLSIRSGDLMPKFAVLLSLQGCSTSHASRRIHCRHVQYQCFHWPTRSSRLYAVSIPIEI